MPRFGSLPEKMKIINSLQVEIESKPICDFKRSSIGPMVARSARGLARAERERPPAAAAGHAEAARAAATRYWREGNRKNILENV